jgi:hypothetical protein
VIRYLRHNEIDRVKWDRCIAGSVNELIYAYSWYLDVVSPGWDALVEAGYESVMPLTWNKKFGFHYLYQPYFTQQLGLFSCSPVSEAAVREFISEIPQKFKLIRISLNEKNSIKGPYTRTNKNFKLNLEKPYEDLYSNYSKSHRKNLRRAGREELQIMNDNPEPEVFVDFIRRNTIELIGNIKHHHYNPLVDIIRQVNRFCETKSITVSTKSGKPCARALFIKLKNHTVFHSASSQAGKSRKAMFLLLDTYIRENAGSNNVLDFSGSNIESIADFFKGFGALESDYSSVIKNRLPWYIKLFIR